MPGKSNLTKRQQQALNRRHREAVARHKRIRRHVEKVRAQEKRATERTLREALKHVKGKGIYEPKSDTLTPYRRRRIKKVVKEYGDLLDPKKYFFLEAPKARREEVKSRAESLRLKNTKRGVFIERQGYRKAILKEDKKNSELYIERSGRVKRGPTRGKKYRTITPLASLDELDREKERLRNLADKFLPLKANQRFAFSIKENGYEGYSHQTFTDIGRLLAYLEHYQKTIAARINFYRHIELEVVESSIEWFAEHPARSPAERRAILKRSMHLRHDARGRAR